MRVGLITTLNTNIGDDFIREGICRVLQHVLKDRSLDFLPVNKHHPLSVYPIWHPIQLAQSLNRLLPRGRDRALHHAAKILHRVGLSRFDACDLIVQCGTPVAWPSCSKCEWAESLWHQVVGRLSRKGVPVLNLGAGSCYPWEHQPQEVTELGDARYLRQILSYCRVTTVRDGLAQRLFRALGYPCPVLPCPAFLAGNPTSTAHPAQDLVVINYMERGGHYDWNQDIEADGWRQTLKTLIGRLRRRHQVVFLCHDRKEYDLAQALDADAPRVLPKNSQEYFAIVSRARVAICNRLHASVAMAGLGIPSVSIGTDTRLLMVEALGLPSFYVKHVSGEMLAEAVQSLLTNLGQERDRLLNLRHRTSEQYCEIVARVF